jgi:hypothetical protein
MPGMHNSERHQGHLQDLHSIGCFLYSHAPFTSRTSELAYVTVRTISQVCPRANQMYAGALKEHYAMVDAGTADYDYDGHDDHDNNDSKPNNRTVRLVAGFPPRRPGFASG